MKLMISRFIAIIILVIPGILAMIGFLKMKDALFLFMSRHGDDSLTSITFDWLDFGAGLILFVIGIGFLGGWIFFRDRKRNYVGPRFRKKTTEERTTDQ
ncbi:uncharacterized membrane protein YjjB (DUF3815 family) [Fontibacillus solani]|uniref:Uncharacterized membrane protein YjjB (DUF3815 family) n=1 Tax=Fontibacillus solani TaxID=1572857 RepID=A0A7W3SZ28_9BACL|nr:DUF2627 domain-containing protein [Fontibacillus solani]MBA9088568.1 uncharacterized membrane protein YjjB (DUF3815 family) [Fontibacillus solani]